MAMEMMVMMIPLKSNLMTMTMASISPLQGEFLGRLLPAGELFSLASFRPMEAAELSMDYTLGLRRVEVRERGCPGGHGPPHHLLARREGHLRHQVVWAPHAPPRSPFWLPPSSRIMGT